MTRTIRLQGDSNAHDRPWRIALEQGIFAAEGLEVEYYEDNPKRHGGPGQEFFPALEGIATAERRA